MSTLQQRSPATDRDVDDPLRAAAVRRLEERREFWTHLTAYVLVNAVLVAIWFVATPDTLFWPVFPIIGWGIGIVFHGLAVFQRPVTEDQIRREMDRLSGGTGS